MSARPIRPRALALSDVDDAVGYYVGEADAGTAQRFVDDLQSAYRLIGQHPTTGSLRYAYELKLPGLRHRLLKRFPYAVFYVERSDYIEVWRVLHQRRDLPSRLTESED